MSPSVSLKHFALRILPEPILQQLRKIHYARKLSQSPEEPEMAVIAQLLPAGGCAIDLGANFGLYTHFLARTVGPQGSVHAVEPVPTTFEFLHSNVERLGLRNTRLYRVAVSDHQGAARMVIPHYEQGGENLYEARIAAEQAAPGGRDVEVPTAQLDYLFGVLGRIDFVKCDVEAHELAVIDGAEQILLVHRPAWLIELSGNPDDAASNSHELVRRMEKFGYRAFRLEGDQLREPGRNAGNYFFLRPEHVRRLAVAPML
jgi:FkbM family methyltransferase